MNNKLMLEQLIRNNSSKPHFLSGYYGLSEDDYFNINRNNDMERVHPTSFKTMVNEFDRISKRLNDVKPLIQNHNQVIIQILKNKTDNLYRFDDLSLDEKINWTLFNESFKKAFAEYENNQTDFDFNITNFSEFELYGVYYGLELSKYYEFLNKQFECINSNEDISSDAKENKLPQQLLTLEYLGVIDFLKGKLKSSENLYSLLSSITGKSEINVKKEMIKKVSDRAKSKTNKVFLTKFRQELEKMDLGVEANKIKKDID